MLILLTAWVVHNWWKLLLGVAAIVVILEYHYYKKPAKEKTGREVLPPRIRRSVRKDQGL